MAISKPLVFYENKHNDKFPDSKISVLYRIDKYIYCNTEFGICKRFIGDFGKYSFGICSAINKTEFLINKFRKIHGCRYNYSEVRYVSNKFKVKIICPDHGMFEQNPNSHASGNGCMECGHIKSSNAFRLNKIDFIKKANLKHDFKYDYSKIDYINSTEKVTIICKNHGEFKQVANSHLQGYGCPKCGFNHVGELNSKNPSGWTLTNWIETANRSKKFDSFKVYIIKCWNEDEEFYKIGRTFLTIKNRFTGKIPYKYKILETFTGEAEYVYKLEITLKSINKTKYVPKIKFAGMHECFKQINYDRK